MSKNFSVSVDTSCAPFLNMMKASVAIDFDLVGKVLHDLGEPEEPPKGFLPIDILIGGTRAYKKITDGRPGCAGLAWTENTKEGIARHIIVPLFIELDIGGQDVYVSDDVLPNRHLVHELRHGVDFADPNITAQQRAFTKQTVEQLIDERGRQSERASYRVLGRTGIALGAAGLLYRKGHRMSAAGIAAEAITYGAFGIWREYKKFNDDIPSVERRMAAIVNQSSPMEVRAYTEANSYGDNPPKLITLHFGDQPLTDSAILHS